MAISITALLKDKKKLVFSRAETLKLLRTGRLAEVFLAANFPSEQNIKNLAELTETKVNKLKQTNDELGALCKKPFAISIIGLKK